MKSRKILAGVCASLMLAAASVTSVSAADTVGVAIGSAKAKAGETFTVNVDLSDIPSAGINGCDFGIKYDSSVIKVTGVEGGALTKSDDSALSGVNALETNIEDGLVSIIYGLGSTDTAKYMTGSGTFLTITGTVNTTAKAGDKSTLKVVAVNRLAAPTGSDENGDIIFGNLGSDNTTCTMYTPTFTDGVIEVIGDTQPTDATEDSKPTEGTQPSSSEKIDNKKATVLGDIDKDGAVGVADVVLGGKYCAAPADTKLDEIAMANGDVNIDGTLNSLDVGLIIEYNLGDHTAF